MRAVVIAGALILSSTIAFATLTPEPFAGNAGPFSRGGIRMAQNCGWFAILGCFPSRGQAENWNDRIESGYVINTTSAAYPAFRPGSYCVVNGPTSYGRAQYIARGWRRIIPDAYVKNSC